MSQGDPKTKNLSYYDFLRWYTTRLDSKNEGHYLYYTRSKPMEVSTNELMIYEK
jgi:hypothetical protein